MNEEQAKEIVILAKELGFKPVTFSTKRVFVEIIEESVSWWNFRRFKTN